MTARGRLGVLGGTFDPIHLGHTETAAAARRALGLSRVIFVPSRTPPHRPQQPVASRYHRFAMAALAVAGAAAFEASDMELLASGPSFTADTLERLRAAGVPGDQIFFITGADAFAEIGTWHRFPEVLDLAHFAVVSRPGHDARTVIAAIPEAASRMAAPGGDETVGPRVFPVTAVTPDVSSTEVRRRLGTGESVEGMLAPAVARHIRQHRLYADGIAPLAHGAADHLHGQD
jgi:nicotinate-nucleotide adenylyltransferase